MLLDTTHNIGTPEGVELRLPVAGIGSRSIAWLIDAGIKFIVLIVSATALAFIGDVGDGLVLLILFAVTWLYNVIFEVFNHGATPGKRALNLRVMNANGTPVGWSGSLVRNLIRFVDSLPGCYAFGAVSVLLSRNFQRLGDMAAGTIVIYEEKKQGQSGFAGAAAKAVKVPLSLDEQQAIVGFGERAARLNRDRAEELAALVEPIFGDVGADGLREHAVWLAGGNSRQ